MDWPIDRAQADSLAIISETLGYTQAQGIQAAMLEHLSNEERAEVEPFLTACLLADQLADCL